MHNFNIGPTDTDSISFCKQDGTPFSEAELESLLKEINDLSPEFMIWDGDGYYHTCIALKAKNYVLYDPTEKEDKKKKKVKGSAFKSSKLEPALKEFMTEIIDGMIHARDLVSIYEKYVLEIMNIQDVKRWSQKKSLTEPILKCEGYEQYSKEELKLRGTRANESNVWDAIKHEEGMQQGDKFYVFPAILDTNTEVTEKTLKSGVVKRKEKVIHTYGLLQSKYWNGVNHDKEHLLKRLYSTIDIFSDVMDISEFKNYSLVKNYKELLDKLHKTEHNKGVIPKGC